MLRLEAVNQMLGGIGQTPVTTLTSQHPDVLAAIATLNRIDKKVQQVGWWFNTDYGLTLAYNPVTKEVIVPGNTMSVEPSDSSLPYVQRGTRLYDYINTTFEIGASVDVDIKQLLDFEIVPESAATAIAASATYELHNDLVGDQNKLTRLEKLKKETHAAMKVDDINNSNINIANNPAVIKLGSGIRPVR